MRPSRADRTRVTERNPSPDSPGGLRLRQHGRVFADARRSTRRSETDAEHDAESRRGDNRTALAPSSSTSVERARVAPQREERTFRRRCASDRRRDAELAPHEQSQRSARSTVRSHFSGAGCSPTRALPRSRVTPSFRLHLHDGGGAGGSPADRRRLELARACSSAKESADQPLRIDLGDGHPPPSRERREQPRVRTSPPRDARPPKTDTRTLDP